MYRMNELFVACNLVRNIFFQLFEFAKMGDVKSLRELIKSETERMEKMANKGDQI